MSRGLQAVSGRAFFSVLVPMVLSHYSVMRFELKSIGEARVGSVPKIPTPELVVFDGHQTSGYSDQRFPILMNFDL